jgi:hypothetical protein
MLEHLNMGTTCLLGIYELQGGKTTLQSSVYLGDLMTKMYGLFFKFTCLNKMMSSYFFIYLINGSLSLCLAYDWTIL